MGDHSICIVYDNDLKLGQLFKDADKYTFVFVNLKENEPVAKAEMLCHSGHLLRLKKYMEQI